MGCDLCGKKGQLYEAKVEGSAMTVCDNCKEHGEIIRRLPNAAELKQQAKREKQEAPSHTTMGYSTPSSREEVLLLVKSNFAAPIKQARERMGLKQEQLAQKLRIKESQLHKYETGSKKPDLETARMLERALGITLIEQHVEQHGTMTGPSHSGPLTIADMIKKKK
jgi:putative transcription factor